jgi:hypothetical protein
VELISSTADRSALVLYLDETKDLTQAEWTPGSWSGYAEARAVAQTMVDAAEPDQAVIDAAAAGLAAAIDRLDRAA